jgi:hypothetical protein
MGVYNPACMQTATVIAILFLGTFTQSVTGFGVGLVSMALLPVIVPLQTASPLVALAALTLEGVLLLRYRSAFNLCGLRAACPAPASAEPSLVAIRDWAAGRHAWGCI